MSFANAAPAAPIYPLSYRNQFVIFRDINSKIEMAKIEYEIELDQQQLGNISKRIQVIKNQNHLDFYQSKSKDESLYNLLKCQDTVSTVHSCHMSEKDVGTLSIRTEGLGLIVCCDVVGTDVKINDRVLEINGTNVFSIRHVQWCRLKEELVDQIRIV